MSETSVLSDLFVDEVALEIAKADGDEVKDAWQWRRHSQAAIAVISRKLSDPNVIHLNMLRGGIAKPSWAQIKHLYPEEFETPSAAEASADRRAQSREPQPVAQVGENSTQSSRPDEGEQSSHHLVRGRAPPSA